MELADGGSLLSLDLSRSTALRILRLCGTAGRQLRTVSFQGCSEFNEEQLLKLGQHCAKLTSVNAERTAAAALWSGKLHHHAAAQTAKKKVNMTDVRVKIATTARLKHLQKGKAVKVLW